MRIFPCGPEPTIRRHLAEFIEEMDQLGVGYGTPGDGSADCQPNALQRSGGIINGSDDHVIWLILSGTAWVSGCQGEPVLVGPGQGVYWNAGEAQHASVDVEPLLYLDVDGPSLTIDHFASPPTT